MEGFVRLLEVVAMPPSHQEMKVAEEQIAQARSQPGFSVMVLQVVLSENLSPPVRQLAAILFKQTVDDQWKKPSSGGEGQPEIPESDKIIIRENAVQALLHCHPQVAKQLREAVKTIVYNDWPRNWPNLIPHVLEILKTQDNPRMLEGAMICYWLVIKKTEWKPKKRETMYALIEETFPFILAFLSHLRTIHTADSFHLQKIICKSFYACFQLKMPPYLRQDEVLQPWLVKFMEILMSPLPEGEPQDPDLRPEWAPWKAKKWCLHIFQRLFVRFGDPLTVKKKSHKKWAKDFAKNYATKILHGVLQIVDITRSGVYLPEKLICGLLRFASTSIRHSSTWPIIFPYCPILIREILFPQICFSDKDFQTWTEDPLEYIRKEYDIFEEYQSVKSTALDVISTFVSVRPNDTFGLIMELLSNVFQTYQSSPDSQKNPRQFEGALTILGTIPEEVAAHQYYSHTLNDLCAQYLLPNLTLQHPHGFVVARACWAFGRYCQEISNPALTVEGLTRCLSLLQHPQLPARVQAALSLRPLVQMDEAKPLLHNDLGNLFQIMFDLINKVDNDDLVSVLDTIIFEFRHYIGPFAVSLSEQLTKELFRLAANINFEDVDTDTYAIAAGECGRTLVTVLSSVRKTPELYPEIYRVVAPFLTYAITSRAYEDFYEDAMKLLAFISYFIPKPFPQTLWEYIPAVVIPHDGFAYSCIGHVIPFLDNMMTRDPQGFLHSNFNGTSYLELVWKLLTYALEPRPLTEALDRMQEESRAMEALKIVEIVFQVFRGEVDFLVLPTLTMLAGRFATAEDAKYKVLLYAVFGNVLYYNPLLAMQHMEQQGTTERLLGSLFVEIEKGALFKRVFDLKQVSLGLSGILQVPANQLPHVIQSSLAKIIHMNVTVLNQINDKLVKSEEGGEKKEGGLKGIEQAALGETQDLNEYITAIRHDDDEGGDEGNGDEDEGDDSDDDDTAQAMSTLMNQLQGYDVDGDDDDSDYEGSDSDEEELPADTLSPIDHIDELSEFMKSLHTFVQREGEAGQQLVAGMGADVTQRLGAFDEELKRREALAQAEAQAQAQAQGQGQGQGQ